MLLLAAPLYLLLVSAHPLVYRSGPEPPGFSDLFFPPIAGAALFAFLAWIGSRPGETGRTSRPSWVEAALIGLLALGLRWSLLAALGGDLPLAGDEAFYWKTARMYQTNPAVFLASVRPPLWGLVLALAGRTEDVGAGRMLALVIGSGVPTLVYLLATQIFDRRTGLVAGLLMALLPEHVFSSHYLLAENLFGFLFALSTLLFVVFARDTRRRQALYWSAAAGGLALLTKEFAVIPLAALFVATSFVKFDRKMRALVVVVILALAPAGVHSVMASIVLGRPVLLSTASISNFQQGAGLQPGTGAEPLGSAIGRLPEAIARRGFSGTLGNARDQLYRLWGQTSYPIIRLVGVYKAGWTYGLRDPWGAVHLVAVVHILAAVSALLALCLARVTSFWAFTTYCLLVLSTTSLVAFLVSRFRLPFLFLLVIYAAHYLTSREALLTRLRLPVRTAMSIALLALLAHAIHTNARTFGDGPRPPKPVRPSGQLDPLPAPQARSAIS